MREVGSYPLSALRDHELDFGARLTLITMYSLPTADRAVVWESASQIAAITNYTPRAVQKHIRALIDRGWLGPVSKDDPRNAGKFHGYELLRPIKGKRVVS